MSTPETASDFERYARILLEAELDAETLYAGEQHYTPRFKQMLRQFGLYGGSEEDLTDDVAIAIRRNVRDAVAIAGGAAQPPDDAKLRELCRRLTSGADDLDDTVALAQAAAILGYCDVMPMPLGTAFNCSVVAVTLLRLGIRRLCRDRT